MPPLPDPGGLSGLSPAPFLVMMAVGFLIGALGHLFGSKTMIGTGIALVFVSAFLLPVFFVLVR